jgi:hypothetical protein
VRRSCRIDGGINDQDQGQFGNLGKKAAEAPSTRKRSAKAASTKSDALIALLSRPQGATIEAMMKASGWQAHSVRGFLAGTLKKKGKSVSSEKTDKRRVYRITGGGEA